MGYFLPSFVQKRLLRYALSRLELIDTDALDLDNLGIKWGQRSSFELRNVGLRLQKLSAILQLPSTVVLTAAKIYVLRITVPADIYTSGIVIEVEGVDGQLRIQPDEAVGYADAQDVRRKSGLPRGVKADRPRSTQPRKHDPGGSDGPPALPSTADLAESFLQSEPQQERVELEAAIASQSQSLHRSSILTDRGDDESETGTQEAVSLPGFIAGFLKGVTDRLQVHVRNVVFRLELELPPDFPTKEGAKSESTIIKLSLARVSIDGLTPVSEVEVQGPGKRKIFMEDIRLNVISDPNAFSSTKFSAPTSPLASRSTTRRDARGPLSSKSDSSVSSEDLAMSQSTILDPAGSITETEPLATSGAMGIRCENDHTDTDQEEAVPESDSTLVLAASQYADSVLDNPSYLEDVINSQFDDTNVEASKLIPPESAVSSTMFQSGRQSLYASYFEDSREDTDSASSPQSRTAPSSAPVSPPSPDSDEVDNQAHAEMLAGSTLGLPSVNNDQELDVARRLSSDSQQSSDDPAVTPGKLAIEDLSASRLYTHEEAESMYMSAVSIAPSNTTEIHAMPGAWESPESKPRKSSRGLASPPFKPLAGSFPPEPNEEKRPSTLETPLIHSVPTAVSTISNAGPPSVDPPPLLPERETDHTTETSSSSEDFSYLSKELLRVENITVWLPDTGVIAGSDDPKETENDGPDKLATTQTSLSDTMVLASSHSTADTQHLGQSRSSAHRNSGASDPVSVAIPDNAATKAVRIELGTTSCSIDMSIGKLVIKAMQYYQSISTPNSTPSTPVAASSKTTLPSISLEVSRFSLKFLERVSGKLISSRDLSAVPSPKSPSSQMNDVLLQLKCSGLHLATFADESTTRMRLDIQSISFGHATGDILSFDAGLKMRDSVRDVLSPTEGDTSITIMRSSESTHVNIRTLPLHLCLDLQKLDEILGWFGGLSGLMELGNSIASTSTIRGGASKSPTLAPKPRGVHFERPAVKVESAADGPSKSPNKTTARIGGVIFELIGSDCTLKLNTTAVKVVHRAEGLGMTVDKAKLTGPYIESEDQETAINVKSENIRVEYLQTPTNDDLARLLSILTPSRDKYDDDDDIMIDTLLRQRRQGGLLRLSVDQVKPTVRRLADLDHLPNLGKELAKLSTVTKYLPEDDRPGILTLFLIRRLDAHAELGGIIGSIHLNARSIDAAHVSIPSLVALQVARFAVLRNTSEYLVDEAISLQESTDDVASPMVMARYIADEMEPTIRIKLYNTRVEYTVEAIMAFTGLTDDMTGEDMAINMANSVMNLAEHAPSKPVAIQASGQASSGSEVSDDSMTPLRLAVAVRDCAIGLNPRKLPSKALIVLTEAQFSGSMQSADSLEPSLELKRASILVIDDASRLVPVGAPKRLVATERRHDQIEELSRLGYVSVSSISSASAVIKMMQVGDDPQKSLDVELRDDLLIIESCADSTQTLLSVLGGLAPPMPPAKAPKYRTQVVPLQDMLASLSGDAFFAKQGSDQKSGIALSSLEEEPDEESPELGYDSNFYQPELELGSDDDEENLSASVLAFEEAASSAAAVVPPSSSNPLGLSFQEGEGLASSALDFRDDYFAKKSSVGGTAHRWNSAQNTYGLTNEKSLRGSPLRVRVRDVHIIWNLFDGYDWQKTRDTISKAVQEVETKTLERRNRAANKLSPGAEDEDESVVGDFLFNSIWIDIPANRDPHELANDINRNIDDVTSESGSYATSTTVTGSPSRRSQSSAGARPRAKKLRLKRSKQHKMTFELKGISADLVVFPPDSGETQSSIDVRIKDLEVFDHLPTSTWKKFATYMHDAGVRETDTSMVHLEILNVKPVPELAASEMVLKATILPLRLHVDQDALDFMTRFFEFKDDSASKPSTAPAGGPFLQRVEVNPVRLRLDFKPKRVDYAGLRSGRTTEFMNFFILDQADMVLRRVILYGVPGFDRLGIMLNSIWSPDVRRNQLPGVLAGLAPIRGVVNVGSGIRDLVAVPIREYKKDGRIVRSLRKGATAFAKTTTNELVKLGAKIAIGTQTVLENTEGFLNTSSGEQNSVGWEDAELDEEEKEQISLYADQPLGVVQGLRGAYASLERDLLLARDAIVAVPGEVIQSSSAGGAAKAVLRKAPTVILRPAIGASKAVGQTLLGAGNTLDKDNWRRLEDKYKRH